MTGTLSRRYINPYGIGCITIPWSHGSWSILLGSLLDSKRFGDDVGYDPNGLWHKILGKKKTTKKLGKSQWLFLVPVKGGRWHIVPQLAVYTTYIPLIYCLLRGLYATYHLLREPETTIEKMAGAILLSNMGHTLKWRKSGDRQGWGPLITNVGPRKIGNPEKLAYISLYYVGIYGL